MKIILGIHNLKKINSHSVITIGNFDGIHLGHQKLLLKTQKIGKQYKLATIVILFEPQPLEFFKKEHAPGRITKLREKIKHIKYYNIDIIICIKFNHFFASLDAKDFIINVLINKLNVKFIITGNDFKFGCKKNGNINLLKKIGYEYQFSIIEIPPIHKNNIKISSTNIRKALSKNNIKLASSFLGRQFSVYGKVIHGQAIGRKIGYPTANIILNKNFVLSNGVYAVKVNCDYKKSFIGICNIGIKPSFCNTYKDRLLEVHLFNITLDLYRKNIEVFIYQKIRDEKFFISYKNLKNQIFQDIKKVKKYFNLNIN